MVDLTKKKTLAEYETGALAGGDTVVTYRPTNAVGEKVFLGNIVAGTAASIADGTSTALKMYSDKALKDAVNTGAIPVGTDTEIETGTDTIAKLYAPDQLNSAIDSLIETAVPDGTKAQIIAGTDTTERKFTPADINGAVKDIAIAQYAGRTAMKAATGLIAGDVVYLSEGGRSGTFEYLVGDYSAEVAADTLEGVYVKLDAVAATLGVLKRVLNGYVTPEMFGAVGDGSDETVKLQAWIDSNTSLGAAPITPGIITEYKYTHLEMSKENHCLTITGDVRFRSIISGSDSSFILSGNFAKIEGGLFLGESLGAKMETTGFSNYLNKVSITGTHTNALKINGLETKVEFGKYRGGTDSAMLVLQPDAFLLGPYLELANNGLKSIGVGSINAYHVHSFGNSLRGFQLSGASFSQMTDCYADTNGSNGYEFSDMSNGLTLTNCWSFKSGELIASSAQMQFSNCQNTKLQGCRMSTPGAAGTSESIRFSGSLNQIDLINCFSDQSTLSFQTPNTMTTCTGELQKYSRARSTYQSAGTTVSASGSVNVTVKLNSSASVSSPGFKSYDIRVTYRSSSGGALVGVEDHTVFILNGISGPSDVVTRYPASPNLPVSAPSLISIGGEQAEMTVTVSNPDATRGFQFSLEVVERSTTRGYI